MSAASTTGQQATGVSVPATSNANTLQEAKRQRNKRILLWLGIAEIVIGLISCALGGATLVDDPTSYYHSFYTYDHFFQIGQGIWCGLILVISGILGVVAHIHPTRAIYRANLALSMLAVIAMVVLLFTSAMAASARSHTRYFIALCVKAFVGIIIASVHCFYSNVEHSTNNRNRRYNRAMYGQVPLQQFTAFQMPNGQIVYYPLQTIPSTGIYPSHVPVTMEPAQMTAPTAMQPVHPAQSVYPTPSSATAPISNINQPMHPIQPMQYPTTAQIGQATVYPPYSGPMVYYPTTVPAPQSGYAMPTPALPPTNSEPNQQMPVNMDAQPSSVSPEVLGAESTNTR